MAVYGARGYGTRGYGDSAGASAVLVDTPVTLLAGTPHVTIHIVMRIEAGTPHATAHAVGADAAAAIISLHPTTPHWTAHAVSVTVHAGQAAPVYVASTVGNLGCPTYSVYVLERGGRTILGDLTPRLTGLSFNRVLDDTSQASVSLGGLGGQNSDSCCELLDVITPWQHEIGIYRNNRLVWVGPVRDVEINSTTGTADIAARDVFSWMFYRFIRDEIEEEPSEADPDKVDIAITFQKIWESAYAADKSFNATLSVTSGALVLDTGTRFYTPEQYQIAGDALRDLLTTFLDMTVVNRTVYVRPSELLLDPIATLVDEHWANPPNVSIQGSKMASRFLLAGPGAGQYGPDLIGEYGDGATNTIGLVERFESLPLLNEEGALIAAAKTRWELLGRQAPVFLTGGRLSPDTPVTIDELIPGKRIDVRLANTCRKVLEQYRLHQVNVQVSDKVETVDVTLTPVGTLGLELRSSA
jgi:hypothetical protein